MQKQAGEAITRSEVEARLGEVIHEESLLNRCLKELDGFDEGVIVDIDEALGEIRDGLRTRLSELDEEETALKKCLETIERYVQRGVRGELPQTRSGLEARLSELDSEEAELRECIETLERYC